MSASDTLAIHLHRFNPNLITYFLVDAASVCYRTEQHLGGVMNDFDLTIYTNERQIEPS